MSLNFFSGFKYNDPIIATSLKYTCPNQNCGKSYKYKPDLNRHLKVYCGKEPNYACFYCDKRFLRKDVWKNHLASVHKTFV